MRSLWILLRFLLLCAARPALAQAGDPASSPEAFLAAAVPLAQESHRETGVPTSVTLAQAILETGWGQNAVNDANNYFGIKATLNRDGSVSYGRVAIGWVWATTREWDGAQYVQARERFRQYRTMADSFRDHGLLLSENDRYADAMRAKDNPDEFVHRMAAAGYATSPTYAQDLIALMQKQNLYRYDLPPLDAELADRSDYVTVAPGAAFQIFFTIRNTGSEPWKNGEYYLENVNDATFGAFPRQELGSDLAPSRTRRWLLQMAAPSEPGVYQSLWRLKHNGVTFGPEMLMIITVQLPETPEANATPWLPVAAGVLFALCVGLLLLRLRLLPLRWRRPS